MQCPLIMDAFCWNATGDQVFPVQFRHALRLEFAYIPAGHGRQALMSGRSETWPSRQNKQLQRTHADALDSIGDEAIAEFLDVELSIEFIFDEPD